MTTANDQAFPTPEGDFTHYVAGLTKLEYFAGLAMQGLCCNPVIAANNEAVAAVAVSMAQALISELEKVQP